MEQHHFHTNVSLPDGSPNDLPAPLDWKAHMNKIMDTIEAKDSRTMDLKRENEILARDYAALQEDLARLQNTQIKPLTDENEKLRDQVEDLRMKLEQVQDDYKNTTDSMEQEIDDLRLQLRDARNECAAVEQQNAKMHDRLREYQRQHTSEQRSSSRARSPSASRHGGGENSMNGGSSSASRRYGSSAGRYVTDDDDAPYPRAPAPAETTRRGANRYNESPGDALVRDLSEKTSMDREYLAPLSDILDRRLGRENTPLRARSRNGNNRY